MDEPPFELRQRRIPGARFEEVDLTGADLRRINLVDAVIREADASGLELRDVSLTGARFRGVVLHDVAIDGLIGRVTLNGVEVGAFVEAELDRLHPERLRLRPTTADGFREAWDVVEELWADTVERARRLEHAQPGAVNESVDGEWSFVDTLRHLALATECWLLQVIEGDPAPWHRLSLPPDGDEVVPCDRQARPSLDEALDYRRDRMAAMRRYLDALTEEVLASHTDPVVDGVGGPPARSYPVRQALQVVLDEEWWHRRFALRDLAVLEARSAAGS